MDYDALQKAGSGLGSGAVDRDGRHHLHGACLPPHLALLLRNPAASAPRAAKAPAGCTACSTASARARRPWTTCRCCAPPPARSKATPSAPSARPPRGRCRASCATTGTSSNTPRQWPLLCRRRARRHLGQAGGGRGMSAQPVNPNLPPDHHVTVDHRRGGAGRAQGLDDHPCRRQGRHPDPALLLPREAAHRGQLPHVPGRRRRRFRAKPSPACATPVMDGHEGLHPQARAEGAAQRDGIPADQPSAGLPDLRPGRRVRVAGPVDGLWTFGQPLRRAQARGGRRGHGAAGRHRDDPLHPVHALRALHRGHRRHLRTRRHAARREPADRHLRSASR
jgi:hypothetical protein